LHRLTFVSVTASLTTLCSMEGRYWLFSSRYPFHAASTECSQNTQQITTEYMHEAVTLIILAPAT
jgi:hypothetical protein